MSIYHGRQKKAENDEKEQDKGKYVFLNLMDLFIRR